MRHGNAFNILLQLLSRWRMNDREYPVPKRDYSRAPLFPLPREGWALLALLAIMFLGAVLRFYGLDFQSLWGGELASWDLGGRDTISEVVRDGTQPPLYFLILHFAGWIFGDSEWALRLPSAVAGWLCIPAIYLLGKKLYSEREGIMAALFVAVLWAPVYYGQEARPYAMLILLSILTSYFWWDLMLGLRYRGELPKRGRVVHCLRRTLRLHALLRTATRVAAGCRPCGAGFRQVAADCDPVRTRGPRLFAMAARHAQPVRGWGSRTPSILAPRARPADDLDAPEELPAGPLRVIRRCRGSDLQGRAAPVCGPAATRTPVEPPQAGMTRPPEPGGK